MQHPIFLYNKGGCLGRSMSNYFTHVFQRLGAKADQKCTINSEYDNRCPIYLNNLKKTPLFTFRAIYSSPIGIITYISSFDLNPMLECQNSHSLDPFDISVYLYSKCMLPIVFLPFNNNFISRFLACVFCVFFVQNGATAAATAVLLGMAALYINWGFHTYRQCGVFNREHGSCFKT